ncbi:MAG: YfcE family phosphodiesterase [Bacillota bacterium]
MLSDSHGDVRRLAMAVREMGQVDVLLHAGDFFEDSRRLQESTDVKVIGVMGNCDHLMTGPVEKVVEAGGKTILLTHGHQYAVKRDRKALTRRAVALGVNIVVFGHTHMAETFWSDGILFFNPGSCRYGRSSQGLSYGTLEISADGVLTPLIHCFE